VSIIIVIPLLTLHHGLLTALLMYSEARQERRDGPSRGNDMETDMVEAAHSGLGEMARSVRWIQDKMMAIEAGHLLAWSSG
jgi:hypothetical protein